MFKRTINNVITEFVPIFHQRGDDENTDPNPQSVDPVQCILMENEFLKDKNRLPDRVALIGLQQRSHPLAETRLPSQELELHEKPNTCKRIRHYIITFSRDTKYLNLLCTIIRLHKLPLPLTFCKVGSVSMGFQVPIEIAGIVVVEIRSRFPKSSEKS